eukprot:jgi/Orpsp1_1/1179534/evm.model.c7180000069751.1
MLKTIIKDNTTNNAIINNSIIKRINGNDSDKYNDIILEKEQELLLIYSSKIKKLEEELIDKNNKLKKFEEKFKLFQEDFIYNLKVLEERDKELENFEKIIAETKKDNELKKETIVNLNFQINVKNKEISGLEEKNRNQENIYNESIKKLKRDFNDVCDNNEKLLNAKMNDYSQLIDDLKNQLTESMLTTKKQKESYEEEINRLKQENFDKINSVTKNLDNKISTLEKDNSQLKNQLLSLQNYNIILEKDKNILIEKKSTMERNIYINHTKSKEKEKEINNKLLELIEENKKINNLLEDNSNCIEEYKLKVEQKENLLKASLKENTILKNHIEELSNENYKVLDDIKTLTKTINYNKNEINLLNKEISKYKKHDAKQKNELNEIKKTQKEKDNENIYLKENYEKRNNLLIEEINELKKQLEEKEILYKKNIEQCKKEWENKYQNIIQSSNDDSKKIALLLEENKSYSEKCNSLEKALNKYKSEEMTKKKNQQLGIEIQKNIEKDLSEIDNLSKINIELPKQLSIDDNEFGNEINSYLYENEPKESYNEEEFKVYYENKKKEDFFSENQTLRQKIIELQNQNDTLGSIIHQMRNDLENIQNNITIKSNNDSNEKIINELNKELQELYFKLQNKQDIIENLIKERQFINDMKIKNGSLDEYEIEKKDCTLIIKNYDKILYENKLLKEKLQDAITDLEYISLERNKLVEISNELKAELKQYEENETKLKDTQTQ